MEQRTMADVKIPEILADLPEDWGYGQIVAPEGESAGLTPQHGYNYLMRRVNECARVLNQVAAELGHIVPEDVVKLKGGGEMFLHGDFGTAPHTIDIEEDIPAAGTRFVIGTTENGGTSASCDYLCDGTADDVEIQEALNAIAELGGGELLFLPGTYHLTADISLTGKSYETISLRGMGSETTQIVGPAQITSSGYSLAVCGLAFRNVALQYHDSPHNRSSFEVRQCSFLVDDPQTFGPYVEGLVYANANIVSVMNCKFDESILGDSIPANKHFLRVMGDRTAVLFNNFYLSYNNAGAASGILVGGTNGNACIGFNTLLRLDTAIYVERRYATVIGNTINTTNSGIDCRASTYCLAVSNHMENISKIGLFSAKEAFGNVISGPRDSFAEIGISLDCHRRIYAANNTVTGFTKGIVTYAIIEDPTTKESLAQVSNNTISGCSTGISLENGERRMTDGTIVPLYANYIRVFENAILGSTIASIRIESRYGKCLISQNLCPDAPIVDQGSNNTVSGNVVP